VGAAETAAWAVLLAAGGEPATAVTVPMAAVLTACAAAHARRWVRDGSHGHGAATTAGTRMLVTIPHVSALATTLAMAVMVAAA
jgi:hypothetical protein